MASGVLQQALTGQKWSLASVLVQQQKTASFRLKFGNGTNRFSISISPGFRCYQQLMIKSTNSYSNMARLPCNESSILLSVATAILSLSNSSCMAPNFAAAFFYSRQTKKLLIQTKAMLIRNVSTQKAHLNLFFIKRSSFSLLNLHLQRISIGLA